LERAAYEASGFVIRRMLDLSGVTPRRVVASGGGSRVLPWNAAMADAIGVPVVSVAVPEGAALGAAFLGRMAAGLETGLEGADRWAKVGRTTEPDKDWAAAASERYEQFLSHCPFDPGSLPEKRD
jgi:xylulokinase